MRIVRINTPFGITGNRTTPASRTHIRSIEVLRPSNCFCIALCRECFACCGTLERLAIICANIQGIRTTCGQTSQFETFGLSNNAGTCPVSSCRTCHYYVLELRSRTGICFESDSCCGGRCCRICAGKCRSDSSRCEVSRNSVSTILAEFSTYIQGVVRAVSQFVQCKRTGGCGRTGPISGSLTRHQYVLITGSTIKCSSPRSRSRRSRNGCYTRCARNAISRSIGLACCHPTVGATTRLNSEGVCVTYSNSNCLRGSRYICCSRSPIGSAVCRVTYVALSRCFCRPVNSYTIIRLIIKCYACNCRTGNRSEGLRSSPIARTSNRANRLYLNLIFCSFC